MKCKSSSRQWASESPKGLKFWVKAGSVEWRIPVPSINIVCINYHDFCIFLFQATHSSTVSCGSACTSHNSLLPSISACKICITSTLCKILCMPRFVNNCSESLLPKDCHLPSLRHFPLDCSVGWHSRHTCKGIWEHISHHYALRLNYIKKP